MLRYGAHTSNDICFKDAVSEKWQKGDKLDVEVTVDIADESWGGSVGVVTGILGKQHLDCNPANGAVAMCGPPIMMKFAARSLMERGFAPEDIYLSLEANMSCSIGKCGHCRLGPYYICKDGPVFSYDMIRSYQKLWD